MNKKKNLLVSLVAIILLFLLRTNVVGEGLELDQFKEPEKGEEIAIIKTNHGNLKVRLFEEIAPKAVENFKTHAKNGYYDKLTFHRIMKDFMIQGGDPKGDGTGGESIWGEYFEDEFHKDYRNFKGALSMANSGPNTNGSQFFIVEKSEIEDQLLADMEEIGQEGGFSKEIIETYKEIGGTPWLDGVHTVFGQVFDGMAVVEQIAGVEVSEGDSVPEEDVVIETIDIVKFGDEDISTQPIKPAKNPGSNEGGFNKKPLVIGFGLVVLFGLLVMLRKFGGEK